MALTAEVKAKLNDVFKTIPALNRPGADTPHAGILMGDIIDLALAHPQAGLDAVTKQLLNDWAKYTPELHIPGEQTLGFATAAAPASGSLTAVATVADADTFTVGDGVISKVFEFDTNSSVVAGHIAVTLIPGVAAHGTLTAIAEGVAGVQDADTFTVSDGTLSKVFEFDENASVLPGHIAVTITAGMTNAQVKTAMLAALVGSPLAITSTSGAGQLINLVNNSLGVAGNVAITESIASMAFLTPVGMLGGVNAPTASQVKTAMLAALVGSPLAITSTSGAGQLINLVNTLASAIGNVAITQSLAVGTLTPVGMTYGTSNSNTHIQLGDIIDAALTETRYSLPANVVALLNKIGDTQPSFDLVGLPQAPSRILLGDILASSILP